MYLSLWNLICQTNCNIQSFIFKCWWLHNISRIHTTTLAKTQCQDAQICICTGRGNSYNLLHYYWQQQYLLNKLIQSLAILRTYTRIDINPNMYTYIEFYTQTEIFLQWWVNAHCTYFTTQIKITFGRPTIRFCSSILTLNYMHSVVIRNLGKVRKSSNRAEPTMWHPTSF